MTLIDRIKPKFWDHLDSGTQAGQHRFNFRRMWVHAVVWTCSVAIVPLIAFALIDYNVSRQSIESEIFLRTSRLVSNTRRAISFFMLERKAALDYVIRDNSLSTLSSPEQLSLILKNLKESFSGFADLGVIDSTGRQNMYVGPYNLIGKDYSHQKWFAEVREKGVYISDVFKGYRNVPHMVIAVRSEMKSGEFHILRASLDIESFNHILDQLELSGQGDAFVLNQEGIIQTPSRYYGNVLEKYALPVPQYDEKSMVMEVPTTAGELLLIGYAYIEPTPFILMIVKKKNELMAPWEITRRELLSFLGISLFLIVVVILSVSTYLVDRIYIADQKRVMALHHIEYTNKMASIGRLSAGVAHEINNPLAIINEKAGLIKDILLPIAELPVKSKLIALTDSVISSVERCAAITHRLLNFARHVDITIQPVDLGAIIKEVLGFLGKEAEYRSIEIIVSATGNVPKIESDKGKLQQIFLNLFNNAFAAMGDGGKLLIRVEGDSNSVSVEVEDNGCGIPDSDLKRIFEPFFSTKTKQGGTGLGLSITYGLVQELGGTISVASKLGFGTKFTLMFPAMFKEKNYACHSGSISG